MAKRKKSEKRRIIFFLFLITLIVSLIYFGYPYLKDEGTLPHLPIKVEHYDITLDYENIYLLSSEEKKITSSVEGVTWISKDEDIATVKDGVVTGKKVGKTTIIAKKELDEATLDVVVTDLITKPQINTKKEYLSCNKYSKEEVELLENILKYRINEAGEKTRAGAVAAARFLTLEFKYRINYFLENGRLITTGNRTLCDGEGRYYHIGLYLHEDKIKDISVSSRGPAIWGCPLYNGVVGKVMDNGLDCSGFISWALLNAGFSPGDGGAGINEAITTDNDDLGKKVSITNDFIKKDKFKVGDLMSRHGHIGMIVGVDKDNLYIAEALDKDLHILVQKKTNIGKTWKYIIDMDEFYEKDGNITNMW